jgi:hypothetical protein
MMTMTPPTSTFPSELADRARVEVNRTVAAYRSHPRHTRRPRLATEPAQVAEEEAITRIIAACEVYVSKRLREVTDFVATQGGRTAVELWRRQENQATATWAGLVDAWRDFHGIDFSNCAEHYAVVRGFVEVRNSVAHGLGKLTKRQLADANTARRITADAGVTVVDGGIRLVADNVDHCARSVHSLVRWLDHAASEIGPS